MKEHLPTSLHNTYPIGSLPADLRPGDLVVDIPALPDYNRLEKWIVNKLLSVPAARGGQATMNEELSEALRPEGFYGNISGAMALVMPHAPQLIKKYVGRANPGNEGFTIIAVGGLNSRKTNGLGFVQEVSYLNLPRKSGSPVHNTSRFMAPGRMFNTLTGEYIGLKDDTDRAARTGVDARYLAARAIWQTRQLQRTDNA